MFGMTRSECRDCLLHTSLVFYGIAYSIGVFIILPIKCLGPSSDCNYFEPAAKVVHIDDIGMVDTKTPCTYLIEWSPLHTPLWSFFPRKLGPVRDSLHLPCPDPSVFDREQYIDGCYNNAIFGKNYIEFEHEDEVSSYDYDITDVRWFRVWMYLAISPLVFYLIGELSFALAMIATSLFYKLRGFGELMKKKMSRAGKRTDGNYVLAQTETDGK